MYEDLLNRVEKHKSNAEKTIDLLEEVEKHIDMVEQEIHSLRERLDFIPQRVIDNAVQETIQEGTHLLLTNALSAIKETEEFDLPIFIHGLELAIRDQRTIGIDVINDVDANVRINLDVTAGTLGDYVEAVKQTRDQLEMGKSRNYSIQAASDMWKEKIYRVDREGGTVSRDTKDGKIDVTDKYLGKYSRTIETRISKMEGPAPWWSILEYGNATLNFGKGGDPYPKYGPTHFVENSRKQILDFFRNTISNFIDRYERNILKSIDKLANVRDQLEKALSDLLNSKTLEKINFAKNIISKYLDQERGILDQVSESKLTELAQEALGERKPTYLGQIRGASNKQRLIRLGRKIEEEWNRVKYR